MKKFAVSLIALAAISGAAFAAADDRARAFDYTTSMAGSVDTNAAADVVTKVEGSDIPNYINRSQLR